MSAPNSKGLDKYGVAKVLSTIKGILFSCAISEILSISQIFIPGLPMVSINTALVLLFIASLKLSGSQYQG